MYILQWIFGIFALLGAIDRMTGNHLKIGSEFEKGILSTGTLALSMVGMITIAPTISTLLIPVLAPVAAFLHMDPSLIGGFIANDMGGASVAAGLATEAAWGGYHGLIVASMMGVTICFTIPVALKTIDPQYHKDVLNGILCGIATIPVGCLVSGLMLGLGFGALMLNLIPVLLVSLVTCLGLIFAPAFSRKIFQGIGIAVLTLITVGLAAGIFTHVTGVTLIPHMAPVSDGFAIVCEIAIILAGVFPLIAVISRIFGKLFGKLGRLVGIDEASVLGLISSLANSIPTFDLIKQMNPKGIMMNMAFAVSASFVFGDHLAFTMAFDSSYLPAMIVGKLTGGVCAVAVACLVYRGMAKKEIA